jgi:hypothetical protein
MHDITKHISHYFMSFFNTAHLNQINHKNSAFKHTAQAACQPLTAA